MISYVQLWHCSADSDLTVEKSIGYSGPVCIRPNLSAYKERCCRAEFIPPGRPSRMCNQRACLMIRQFINICLVLSTLGYGMAVAFDGHLDESQVPFSAFVDQHEDHDTSDCDHCCHANAHLTGIAATGTRGLSANCSIIYSAYTQTLVSFLELPTAPPPKH